MRSHLTITVCIPSLGQRSTMLLSGPSTSSDLLLSHCSAGGKWIPDRPAPASDVSRVHGPQATRRSNQYLETLRLMATSKPARHICSDLT